jgi:hypothetical protein
MAGPTPIARIPELNGSAAVTILVMLLSLLLDGANPLPQSVRSSDDVVCSTLSAVRQPLRRQLFLFRRAQVI